ncbi:hypothetical protein V8F33_009577 [Rhypophila sp. PSN 637]
MGRIRKVTNRDGTKELYLFRRTVLQPVEEEPERVIDESQLPSLIKLFKYGGTPLLITDSLPGGDLAIDPYLEAASDQHDGKQVVIANPDSASEDEMEEAEFRKCTRERLQRAALLRDGPPTGRPGFCGPTLQFSRAAADIRNPFERTPARAPEEHEGLPDEEENSFTRPNWVVGPPQQETRVLPRRPLAAFMDLVKKACVWVVGEPWQRQQWTPLPPPRAGFMNEVKKTWVWVVDVGVILGVALCLFWAFYTIQAE